jgi:hypothetical protein
MTSREKKLAIVFGALVAVLGLGLLFRNFAHVSAFAFGDPAELQHKLLDMQSTVGTASIWGEREIWLDANTPYHQSDVIASSVLLDKAGAVLKSHKLRVITQELKGRVDPEEAADPGAMQHFDHVSVHIVAEGDMQDIVRFIHELQTPENFMGVEELKLEAGESGDYIATLLITHWFGSI